MKRLALLFALCLPVAAVATAMSPQTATLASRIDAVIDQPRYAHADWGIAVLSLDNGRTLYAHRADKLAQPASTAKLFTAALTLATLGTDARIPTRLVSAAPLRHGRLDGPLLLYGMGDPTLGTPQANPDWADDLAAQLATHGIHAIRGDLIADAGYFSGPQLGSGWEASDLLGWFAAPASALSVHENIVALTVTPAAEAAAPARLDFAPAIAAPPLQGRLLTTAAGTAEEVNFYRAPGEATLHAFGGLALDTPAHTYRLAIPDPARQAGTELRKALARHHIRLQGRLRVLAWPQDDAALLDHARTLAEVRSPTTAQILTQGLKRSQNLYLQNLLKIAGVHAQAAAAGEAGAPAGFPGSEAWGLHALRLLLERIGIAPATVQLEEGTGLARGDLVTPTALVQLLRYLAAQPDGAAVRAMLPVAGVDGTLAWRLREAPTADKVQAKTGSMRHVHSLAGYLTRADGEQLVFAIMLNNTVHEEGEPPATRDIDAIVDLLATWRENEKPSAPVRNPDVVARAASDASP